MFWYDVTRHQRKDFPYAASSLPTQAQAQRDTSPSTSRRENFWQLGKKIQRWTEVNPSRGDYEEEDEEERGQSRARAKRLWFLSDRVVRTGFFSCYYAEMDCLGRDPSCHGGGNLLALPCHPTVSRLAETNSWRTVLVSLDQIQSHPSKGNDGRQRFRTTVSIHTSSMYLVVLLVK